MRGLKYSCWSHELAILSVNEKIKENLASNPHICMRNCKEGSVGKGNVHVVRVTVIMKKSV
jgi:hypothetical protein